MKLSNFELVLTSTCLFVCHCSAFVELVLPTSDCSFFSEIGLAVFCCDGDCQDGSTIFSGTGVCKHWDDPCNDPVITPSCSNDQTISPLSGGFAFDSGGDCYASCNWQNFNYTWSCCDCPVGSIPVSSVCSPYASIAYTGNCLGCSDPNEKIQYNETSGGYVCVTMSSSTTSPSTTSSSTTSSATTTTSSTTTASSTTTSSSITAIYSTTSSSSTSSSTTSSSTTSSSTTSSSTTFPSATPSSPTTTSSTTSSLSPSFTLIFDNKECGSGNCARAVMGTRMGKMPDVTSRAEDCLSFMRITVTPGTSTITKTTTTTLTPLKKRQSAALEVRQVTISPSKVPTYAAACARPAQYSSACSCWGITAITTTAPTPLKTKTVAATVTAT